MSRLASPTERVFSAEAAGALVACFDTGAFVSRRHTVVSRLRQLRDGDHFADLPDDLQHRIREIVAASER